MSDTVIADFDRTLTREVFDRRAAQGAAALTGLGAGADVPVAVIMRNDLTQLEVMRAAAMAGTVIVAQNWHAAADEAGAICDDSGARFVIIHRDLIDALRPALEGRTVIAITPDAALREAYGIDDVAAQTDPETPEWSTLVDAASPITPREMMRPLMRYTSGSTGKPKGVRRLGGGPKRDFEDVLSRVGTEMLQLKPGSRFFTAAPSLPFGAVNAHVCRLGDPRRVDLCRAKVRSRKLPGHHRSAADHPYLSGAHHDEPDVETAPRGQSAVRPILG